MDELKGEKVVVSLKIKLEKIKFFCEFFGCVVKKIIQYIIDRLNDLFVKYIIFLDILWKFIEGFIVGIWKFIIVEVMKILGYILFFVGLVFLIVGLFL